MNAAGPDSISDRAKDAFQEILDATPEEREKRLKELEAADASLAATVQWLLDAHARAGEFLELKDPDETPLFQPMQRVGGRFLIRRMVGRGGMGEVYEAHDEVLNETVALKTIRRRFVRQPDARRRFLAEVQHARKVTHVNICRIFDVFEDPADSGVPFFSMEYLDGITLAQALKEKADLPRRAIALQIAEGLQAAHAQGILHRDLKPSNVVLTERDGKPRAAITDFGLAALDAPSKSGEAAGGTPRYMSPELLAGAAPSVASDIYALGRLLESLMPGHAITARCVSPDPAKRPQSAQNVIDAFRAKRFVGRRWVVGAGIAAGVAVVWRSRQKASWTGRRRLVVDIAGGLVNPLPNALLAAALHQSPRFSVIPDGEVQQTRRRLKTAASESVAAELRAPLILTSRLENRENRWLWRLELRDRQSGSTLGSAAQDCGAKPVWTQAADRAALAIREMAGETGEALKASYVPLEQTTSSSERAVEAYYEALRRIEAAEVNEALILLEEAIAADPGFAIAYHEKARALSILAREISALAASEQAFRLRERTTHYERLWIEGMCFAFRADTTKAMETFRSLATHYPDDARVWRQFAQLCGLCVRTGEAVQAARKVVELDPYSAIARVQMALLLCEDGREEEALTLAREARREGLNHPSLDWAEGQAHMNSGQYGEARASFDRMRQGSAFDRQARLRSSALSIAEGKLDEAVDTLAGDLAYDQSAEEEQRQFRSRHWLALLYGLTEQPAKAAAQIKALLQLPASPACLEAYRNAALCACFIRELESAKRALGTLREIAGRWPSRHTAAFAAHAEGQIALAEGDPAKARARVLEALGLWQDPLTRLSLGWCYAQGGQHDEASRVFMDAETQRGFLLRRENPAYLPLLLLAHARSEAALTHFDESLRLYERMLSMWSPARGSARLVKQAASERNALAAKHKIVRGKNE